MEGVAFPHFFFLQFNNCSAVIVAATLSLELAFSLCVAVAIMQIDCEFFLTIPRI